MDSLGTHLLPDLQDCDADLLDDVDLVRDSQHYVLEITNYGEELKSILMDIHESDRKNREFIRAMHKEDDGSCDDCTDEYLCEYHDPDGALHEYTNITEDDIDMLARAMRNLAFNRDRLYMDRADGRLKLRPRNYIDDS